MLKQFSNRVSAKTIEETYTENDVEHVVDENGKQTTDLSAGYNSNTGFSFDYPMRWLNDKSEFKAIGIRRLQVVPTSHVFMLNTLLEWKTEAGYKYETFPFTLSIIPENNFEEIMHNIINTLNQGIPTKLPELQCFFMYNFDYRTGEFSMSVMSNSADITEMNFAFNIHDIGTQEKPELVQTEQEKQNNDFFLKFLNQERTDANRAILTNRTNSKAFHNVWDRKSLQFHASFSDNKRGFIGLNNDFYENPSVFYDPPTNSSNFWIKFTTDGIHLILPRYCKFYIGLCYVRNYKNSLVTK